ncbi:type II secretion system F family protein [Pigmentiphaga sp. CHJ604]|uniref:type II secretion system F family protein n=1 Tax=Pigmentiphaga sp. CHJ604 TaxID=3081984 RepID=UPI0030CAC264
MLFRMRVYDPAQGTAGYRELEAADLDTARAAMADQGLVVLQARSAARLSWQRRKKPDIRLLSIELAGLLRAGLSLAEALETLSLRGEGTAAAVYRELLGKLMEGLPLSDALASASYEVPAVLIAAVRANERTGRIADALEEYAKYAGALSDLRRKVLNAAVYPMLVVGFGFLVAVFLLAYVVPRFAGVYDGTAAQVSTATRVLLTVGATIDRYGLEIAVGCAATGFAIARLLWDPRSRARVGQSLVKIGPLRRFAEKFQLARISASLGMLLKGGYDLPGALRLAQSLAFSDRIRSGVEQASLAVNEGRPVSNAWATAGLADAFAKRILLASERTGDLAVGFDALAATYSRELETALERASRLVEPILLMAVASLIGSIVVLIYMPIFDLAGILQ